VVPNEKKRRGLQQKRVWLHIEHSDTYRALLEKSLCECVEQMLQGIMVAFVHHPCYGIIFYVILFSCPAAFLWFNLNIIEKMKLIEMSNTGCTEQRTCKHTHTHTERERKGFWGERSQWVWWRVWLTLIYYSAACREWMRAWEWE